MYLRFMIILFFFFSLVFSYQFKNKLSDYNIFLGNPHELITTDDFIPYELITPLFTDYSWKHRAIHIPDGKKVVYHEKKVFDFPIGTIISKTFYYPNNFNDLTKGISLKETRIMIHTDEGWIGLPYIWNEQETDAYLEIVGGIKKADWIDLDNNFNSIDYIVPNINQCKGCHVNNNVFKPIGPTARQINSDYIYGDEVENQLIKWNELKLFLDFPNYNEIPRIHKWDDINSGTINDRARAWLDINCAHCHNQYGPANNTGLFLDYYEKDLKKIGIYKTPVAAGRGSGNLEYDIVPGYPNKSIMVYRFDSTDPGIMMPELGRTMVHKEGLELIRQWIKSLN